MGKLVRLKELVARREQWRDELDSVRRMHARVLEVETLLAGGWATCPADVTNAAVGERFDDWIAHLREETNTQHLTDTERRCLKHFLHVTTNLRPHLIQCYDLVGLPRTNNDMEGFIRAIKTRYRRISGRKNWNRYLLRYGRRVAFYEAQVRMELRTEDLELDIRRVEPTAWRSARAHQRLCQEEQLKQHRFRHKRAAFLHDLEERWASVCSGLLP